MSFIPEETIEKVISSTDIVEVISNCFPLKKRGINYVALCPFHSEKTPSFSVNPARQTFHCFGCGAGGNAARFVMDYQNFAFTEAIRFLANRAGIPIVEEKTDPKTRARQELRQRLIRLHQEAAEWYHQLLMKSEVATSAREYLKSRGINGDTARTWKLGFAPGSSQLFMNWAAKAEFDTKTLLLSGLASESDRVGSSQVYARFRDRLMFPVWNDYGDVIAFSGRTLLPDAPVAKYLNSPETPLFQKSKVLFGLNLSKRAILKKGKAVICEGQIDLITCFSQGLENIVAPLGTAFTSEHARILRRHTEEVVLCFDADKAGFEAALRTFQTLIQANVFVKAVRLPEREDPDSYIRQHGIEAFEALIDGAADFLEFQIESRAAQLDLNSPKDQRVLAQEIAESVALITDKAMQDAVINQASVRLRLSSDQFRETLVELSQKNKRFSKTGDSAQTPVERTRFVDSSCRLLCQMSMVDSEVKRWFSQVWSQRSFLQQLPDARLLTCVAEGTFDPSNSASISSFLGRQPVADERALAELLADIPQGNQVQAAHDALMRLERDWWNHQLQHKESALRQPTLSVAEMLSLLQEIRLLKEKLDRVAVSQDSGAPHVNNPQS